MKAAVFKGKGIMEVETYEKPQVKPHEVLVEVKACGVCGTDIHIYSGDEGAAACTPPTILGHEFSGVIAEVGEAVTTLKVGDRVSIDPNDMCGKCYYCNNGLAQFCESMIGIGTTVNGGFSQYAVVNAKQAFKLDESISFEEGAMVEPIACCLHGIDMCDIKVGHTVMVIGGGAIGLMMLQLARLKGAATVILSEPVQEKRELALELGADIVIDPINEDIAAVIKANGIKNIDATIECVGLKQTMMQAVEYAGKSSTAMLFGLGHPEETLPIKPFELFKKECTVKASFINPYTQQRAIQLLKSKRIHVEKLITKKVSLEEFVAMLEDKSYRTCTKVIVDPWK